MATESEPSCQNFCANDPNFAIICSFFDRFANTCGIVHPTFAELQEMLEKTDDAPAELIDLHVKLLRKIRRSVATEKWERALIKFCHSYYCSEEGWELERCGYRKCKVSVRLKILKTLLDAQFDLNIKFKNDINKLTAEELRLEPLGRDKIGQSYWCQFDSAANVRVYKEDQDEESWMLVAKDREGLVDLITQLSSGEDLLGLEVLNEDSNSLEVEKPITDTGQVQETTSEENTADSLDSKNKNVLKDEDCLSNSNGLNGTCDKNVDKELLEPKVGSSIIEETSAEEKVKSSETEEISTSIKNENDCGTSDPKQEDLPSFVNNLEDECKQNLPKIKSEPENVMQKPDLNAMTDRMDDLGNPENIELNNPTEQIGSETIATNDNNEILNQKSILDTVVTSGQIKDVAAEIKQRSLHKFSGSTLFKGKIGKTSSGSKLDQIFSRKLEQSNHILQSESGCKPTISTLPSDNNKINDKLSQEENESFTVEGNLHDSLNIEDETDNKRKADETSEQLTKRKCVDTDFEVGEEIEEPVMLIQGEGSGRDCDTGNPGLDNEEVSESATNKNSLKNTAIQNKNSTNHNSDEVFTNEISLNNGVIDENKSDNEAFFNNDFEKLNNHSDHTEKIDSGCEKKGAMKSSTPDLLVRSDDNKDQDSYSEREKSIEEQLSDLTGECFSPPSRNEFQKNIDKPVENHSLPLKDTEKGVRRKSLQLDEDNESFPPEIKKTRVEKDCSEIFGTDDSVSYSGEENKCSVVSILKEKDSLKMTEKCPSSNDLSGLDEEDTKLTSCNTKLTSCNTDILENKSDKNEIIGSNIDDENQINKELDDSVLEETNSNKNKSNSRTDSALKNDNIICDQLNTNNENKHLSENETTQQESNFEVSNTEKGIEKSKFANKKRNGKEKVSISCEPEKSNEKEELEAPEKKKKMLIPQEKCPEVKEISSNNSVCEETSTVPNSISDKNEERESSSKDENESNVVNKKPSPKKATKPRRKIFTPKSRKGAARNRNKNSKTNLTEEDITPEKKVNESMNTQSKENVQSDIKNDNNDSKNTETNVVTDTEKKPKPIAGRKRRNSRKTTTEKESEDDITTTKKINKEDEEEIGGKRRKVKGRRAPNKSLRKSVEDKRNYKSSSEEESQHSSSVEKAGKKNSKQTSKTATSKPKPPTKSTKTLKSTPVKPKPSVKSSSKNKKEDSKASSASDEHSDKKKKTPKSQGKNSRAFLGIDLDIDLNDTSRSVRQSSRIAQIKIKEQADHKLGDEQHHHLEKSGKKTKKKKKKDEDGDDVKETPRRRKKPKKVSDDDVPEEEPSSEKKRRRRRKKKKHPLRAFNERDPWKSSSGSSSEAEEEEEDHFDDIVEEEEDLPLTIKSDHEFSPESDLEADGDVKPVRRARTAQKDPTAEGETGEDVDDFACEKCGKKDHPEWILLCDTCDHGWHASCLRPSLMLIPEGDWHCPPCQHAKLVQKLQETLKIYDRDTKRRENEELRRKRLAYVGISLDNVLPSNAHQKEREKDSASESGSNESSESASESESEYSDEPVYQLRQRRQGTTSYRFNEFDELINSAIRDEVEGNGVGVISNVVPEVIKEGVDDSVAIENGVANGEVGQSNSHPAAPEKTEKVKKKRKDESNGESSGEDEDNDDEEEDEEFPRVVPKRTSLPRPGRKKHRKLNSLDDPSDDDDGSDEDFKGSSSEEEEEEEDDEEDSDESGVGRRRSKRANLEPVRRSSRARKARFDKEFINDDSEESDAPRRKKTRKLWSDSNSESEDSTWGRRKKKKGFGSSRGKRFKKSKKFTIEDELSEIESSKVPKKKRQRKIKYGGLDDLAIEELPSRRTRGKKINYQEVLGSETDEDIGKSKSYKKSLFEDDEFVAEKEAKEESATSSAGEEDETGDDEKSSEGEEEEEEGDGIEDEESNMTKSKGSVSKDKDEIKTQNDTMGTPTIRVLPPNILNKDNVTVTATARRGRPPKAMIAPPPERLISEDEQYKAVVSKVATHTSSDVGIVKPVNVSENPQRFSETKDFVEPVQPVTPIKIPNNSYDPKFVKRSPPIKIRSGVPVNPCGRKSPSSPTSETSQFPVKSPTAPLHSPPDKQMLHVQRNLLPLQTSPQHLTTRKSIITNVKAQNMTDDEGLDDLDEEDLIDDIEEEEDDEDDSDDDVLEEGEIPKKVARRMARMEERMQRIEEKNLVKQVEKLKSVKSGAVTIQPVSPGAVVPTTNEEKPPPTTQPSQPLLRVVSPLKLMANPPGPLQTTFMNNPGMSPRVPMSSPPPSRMPMQMRPPQQPNMMPIMPGPDGGTRRGRGKKQEKSEVGGNVILQQPQCYPPTHYQQYPRIPYNPQQRMPRPGYHPGHHPLDPSPSGGGPINVKQEPGAPPTSNPVHIPGKPPVVSAPPYHPSHRFDIRRPPYPQQSEPRPQYGSYPPPHPPVSSSGYHFGSYPPPREDYPPQQQYNEHFSDQPAAQPTKSFSEEESGGEFGGLVSYFSSQREEDIDT